MYLFSETIMSYDFLTFIECFIVYCMMGWAVESLYMSFCERRLVNRGFSKGPFCPIYGFGATFGYILLHPFSNHIYALYFAGVISATCFEFFVGILMQHFLHQVWWDYNEKPFNFRGIICLESSVAWGFYAIAVVRYLNPAIVRYLGMIPRRMGIVISTVVISVYMLDFFYHLLLALDKTPAEYKEEIKERVREFRARW